MIFEQKFPFPPLSQNNIERTGRKTNHRYKTDQAKNYKHEIQIYLASNKDARLFRDVFDKDKHIIFADYIWLINKDKYFKKPKRKGELPGINQTAIDIDNPVKYTQDCIMRYLDINDSFIKSSHQDHLPTDEKCHFIVKLRMLELRYFLEIVSSRTQAFLNQKA